MGVREIFKITRIVKKFDKATGVFRINIAYKTKTDITDRTIAVAEAFGLGVDQFQKHVIYDNVELKIGPKDIVYITGDSGSGKSVLLKHLEKQLAPNTININKVRINRKKPLIDTVGETVKQGLELLSRVGLNDAFLFVRRYSQLSDGQKYRYRIAKMIESGAQYWVADEFCATLDRDTAKIVAFNVQKLARQEGKAILVATTHTDLLEDLQPSVHVHKGFGREIEVKYFPNELNKTCSLVREMQVEEGNREDYKKLAGFHYRNTHIPIPIKIFTLKHNKQTVGVIVYSFPPTICFGRKKALGKTVHIQELNRNFANISRVVLHPKYRTIGLGARLVRETLPLVGRPYVEAMAVMARYNPFFEKAGMTKVAERLPDKSIVEAVEKLRELGFNPVFLASEKGNQRLLKQMNEEQRRQVKQALLNVSSIFYRRLAGGKRMFLKREEFRNILENATIEKLAKMLRILGILMQTKVYLIWKNPTINN
jgi:ABC-type ATPase with predicted acetyltransferase domain